MTKKARLLLVEDHQQLARAYLVFLQGLPCELEHASSGVAALQSIRRNPPDLLLLDLLLPDLHGLEVLDTLRQQSADAQVIIVTSEASADLAARALQAGASDYLLKPLDGDRLRTTVRNTLDRWQLEQRLHDYESALPDAHFGGFVGDSPCMRLLYRIIDNAASSDASVFITGESGTGKELCANAIHQRGRRGNGPLVIYNCGAIPSELMESELFGHVQGAFTGATQQHEGAAARADGGTLFFDEVCEMTLELQVKLLRFLQTRRFLPVGGKHERDTDVRFICATNRDPLEEVRAGRFREDLYYRLFVVPIELPPLRERGQDIILLARHALTRFATADRKFFSGFSPAARQHLLSYSWPGNVRQLENLIQQLVVFNPGGEIGVDQLPHDLRETPTSPAVSPAETPSEQRHQAAAQIRPLWEEEREVIERAVSLCDGNVVEAAQRLGISDSTIYRKRQRWLKQPRSDG